MFIDGNCILQFYKDTLASPTEKSAKLEAGKADKEADDAETQVKEGKSAHTLSLSTIYCYNRYVDSII